MEFEGRIIRVLPTRSGTSQRGNDWKALSFVFAYYENGEQRWEDKVLLETWDTNTMAQIARYCEIGADGKAIIENGSVKLKTLDIRCRCGFSHNVKDVPKRDGSGSVTMNDLRCYKLEIGAVGAAVAQQHTQQAAQQYTQQVAQQWQAPFPMDGGQEGGHDDLPF